MALASDVEKIPTPVNKPASGSYGDKVSLDRLKQSLPSSGQAPAGQPGGNKPMGEQPPMVVPVPPPGNNSPQQPAQVPQVLFGPTARPYEPVSAAPPVAPPPQAPVTGPQARMELLITLANSPDVSEDTREWAQLWIRTLTR